MQETDRPLETSADHLNQVPGLNEEEVANRSAAKRVASKINLERV